MKLTDSSAANVGYAAVRAIVSIANSLYNFHTYSNITISDIFSSGVVKTGLGTLDLIGGNSNFSGNVYVNEGVAQFNTLSGNITISGNLYGGASIIHRGTGASATTLFFSGNNSNFTGSFTQWTDTNLRTAFNNSNSGSENAAWTFTRAVAGGVALNFSSGTIKFGSLSGSGNIRANAGSVTVEVGNLNVNTTFSGILQEGSVSVYLFLTKVGTGSLTLTGANTYKGATSILAGKIISVKGTATATFTNTALSVTFSTPPVAGNTFRFFSGATTQTYATVTLVGATGRTATYNSTNSTLTIA
jgi:autotransporter-associated beta strand protein